MIGTEKRRYCGECKLNVYNLSGMSRDEAENLIANAEGRLCVRFFQRADGTVLTQDCPVGWQAVKKRVSKTATAGVSLFIGLLSGLGLTVFTRQNQTSETVGISVRANNNRALTGKITVKPTPYPLMENNAIELKGEMILGQMVSIKPGDSRNPKR